MTELPHLQPHEPPLDVCHRNHSGVAHHILPGCTCDNPSGTVPIRDAAGKVIEHREVKLSNHVMVHDANGDTRSLSLEDARLAGFIS